MATTIMTPDGGIETVFDLDSLLRLIEERMGYEARDLLEEWIRPDSDAEEYIACLEKEVEAQKARRMDAMKALRKQSETIAGLIREKEIDRVKLSHAAGAISLITWREINVG